MIRTPEAKQLCTKAEFELFTNSLSRSVKRLSKAQLPQAVGLARKARDKYRSLANRQRREARGTQQPRGTRPSKGAQRTVRKAELFAETLERYEKRLADVRGKSKTTSKKKAAAKKKPAKKKVAKAPTKKAAKKKSARRKKQAAMTATRTKVAKKKASAKKAAAKPKSGVVAAAVRHQQTASGMKRKRKHLSAQGKRRQARRDAKPR